MTRPDLAHLPIGEVIPINGLPMQHMGGGRFQPAIIGGEPILKRFDPNEGEPLHRWAA